MIEAAPSGLQLDLAAITMAVLCLAMVLEMLIPARKSPPSPARWLSNACLSLLAYGITYIFATLVAVWVLQRLGSPGFWSLGNKPLWFGLLITFTALEAARYGIHIAMHKVPWLWRFHAVHHSDPEVDVTTSFRHHPIEGVLTVIPISALMWLLALPPQALILYRAWDLTFTIFTHTNIALSPRIERWLRLFVVTPAFHRTHHFADQPFTDSNYGATLPWFDYLFSTYRFADAEQQRSAELGLGGDTTEAKRLDAMLLAPFRRNRNQESD